MLIGVQAGNSDNKLTQQQWAGFIDSINRAIASREQTRHLFGESDTRLKWQNVYWVVEVDPGDLDQLRVLLANCRKVYDQGDVCLLTDIPHILRCIRSVQPNCAQRGHWPGEARAVEQTIRRLFDSSDQEAIIQFDLLARQAVRSGMWLSLNIDISSLPGAIVFEYERNPLWVGRGDGV